MKQRFGEYLIERGVIDPFTLVQALNIQRRRGLIPLGEIALHDRIVSAEKLLAILDVQENSGRKFGEIALELGYLTQAQINVLCQKQRQLHSYIGEVLVEMNKIRTEELDSYLADFRKHNAELHTKSEAAVDHISSVEDEEAASPSFSDDVFISVSVDCPICRQKGEQRVVDNGLYEIESKDIDLKPSKFLWEDSALEALNPLLYNIWECPHCHFSLGHEDFELPTKDIPPSLHHFRKKVVDLLTQEPVVDVVIDILAPESNPGDAVSYMTAIRRYLLAIHLYLKVPILTEQEGLPLAQLCLHLAWIFRDMRATGEYEKNQVALKALRTQLNEYWSSAPLTETAALEKALEYYDVAVYQSRTLVERGIEHKVTQLMARINIRLKRIRDARKLLLDTVMTGNKQISDLKKSLRPENSEFNRQYNKNIMKELCRINAFVKETKALLEFCASLK